MESLITGSNSTDDQRRYLEREVEKIVQECPNDKGSRNAKVNELKTTVLPFQEEKRCKISAKELLQRKQKREKSKYEAAYQYVGKFNSPSRGIIKPVAEGKRFTMSPLKGQGLLKTTLLDQLKNRVLECTYLTSKKKSPQSDSRNSHFANTMSGHNFNSTQANTLATTQQSVLQGIQCANSQNRKRKIKSQGRSGQGYLQLLEVKYHPQSKPVFSMTREQRRHRFPSSNKMPVQAGSKGKRANLSKYLTAKPENEVPPQVQILNVQKTQRPNLSISSQGGIRPETLSDTQIAASLKSDRSSKNNSSNKKLENLTKRHSQNRTKLQRSLSNICYNKRPKQLMTAQDDLQVERENIKPCTAIELVEKTLSMMEIDACFKLAVNALKIEQMLLQ